MLIWGLLCAQSYGQEINKTSSLPTGIHSLVREKDVSKRDLHSRPSMIRAVLEDKGNQKTGQARVKLSMFLSAPGPTCLCVFIIIFYNAILIDFASIMSSLGNIIKCL